MTSRARAGLWILWAVLLAIALPADRTLAEEGPGPPLEVTYLANEGVLVEAGTVRVVIDGLFADGIPGYRSLRPARRGQLEKGQGPFVGISLALETHLHPDHFDAATAARFLASQPRASLVGPPQLVEALRKAAGDVEGLEERLYDYLPEPGKSWHLEFPQVTVEVFNLSHGVGSGVENAGFLVETGGWKLLHVGDAAVTGAEIRPYGLASRGLDLAFLPFWYLLDAQGDELLQAVGARVVVGVHVPAPAAASEMFGSPGSLEALEEAVTARHPKVRLLVEPGDRWVMRR